MYKRQDFKGELNKKTEETKMCIRDSSNIMEILKNMMEENRKHMESLKEDGHKNIELLKEELKEDGHKNICLLYTSRCV